MESYKIIKKLGQGGFGKIYLATKNVINLEKSSPDNSSSQVVLKVYREKVDWEKIEQSLELAMTLQHPNLMKCYSFFHDRIVTRKNELTGKSTVHIVAILEPLQGETLYKSYIDCQETFSHYLSQIVSALKYLHSKKIIHGDIKPDNILVVNGKVKLIDYDFLTKEKDARKTRMGTPLFSAPEIYQKLGNTCKSDLWSLGVTIYYCLTQKYPYTAKTKPDLMRLISSNFQPDFSELPNRYGQIVKGLLHKNPEKRMSLSQLSQILT